MLTFPFVGLCGFVFKCVKKIFKGQFLKNEKWNILIELYTLCPFMSVETCFRFHTSYLKYFFKIARYFVLYEGHTIPCSYYIYIYIVNLYRIIFQFSEVNNFIISYYLIYLFLSHPNTLSVFGKFQQLEESFTYYICQMSCGQVYDSLC